MTEYHIDAAQLGSTVLTGTTGRAMELTRDMHRPETAGNFWNRLSAIKRKGAVITLTTASAKQLLDLMPQGSSPALPVPLVEITEGAPLTLWAIKDQDNLPLPATGVVHEKLVITKGVIALRRMAWAEVGDPTMLTATVWPLSTDGEAPLWTATEAAKPNLPPVDQDMTLEYLKIGSTEVDSISDLSLEIECPWQPRWKSPRAVYTDYLATAGPRGIIVVRASWRSMDRSLLRLWGDGFKDDAVQTITIATRTYGQLADRGDVTDAMDLQCSLEVSSVEDGRPGTVQVTATSISTDGTNPFRWGIPA
jgi:hypothetical protein